ncbi:glycoside hydrolase [Spirillospora sp. CA-253888]
MVSAKVVVSGLAAAGVAVAGCGSGGVEKSASVWVDGGAVVVPLTGGEARVDVAALGVTARGADGRTTRLSDPAKGLGAPGEVTRRNGAATWTYPQRGLTVTAKGQAGRLVVDVRSAGSGKLTWPITGTDERTSRLAVPMGAGLGVPVDDPFWNSAKGRLAGEDMRLAGDLTMPFWGYQVGAQGASYIVPTDIGTTLKFVSRRGRLHGETTHTFGNAPYTVAFSVTGSSPVAAAADYRRWMSEHGELGSFKEKVRRNPEVGKLAGAFHAYLWGDAMTAGSVRRMKGLGLDRMWLGYDSTGDPMKPDAVAAAGRAGYLVGPYDSWANAQPPATADTPSSRWPDDLYPKGCVHDAAGKAVEGFHGRGCYLSSQALAKGPYLADRTKAMTANGATGYFLDVDAAGELFRDHSPSHPMTEAQDRANRVARMGRLSERYVVGSEKAAGWANKVIAFDHGAGTESANFLWPLERDKESWGRYWPPAGPKFFFKPVDLPADAAKGMFDPSYRLPLYETVLHDSVVNLDRWELSLYKLPNVKRTRVLLAMLYNTPLNFTVDGTTLAQHGQEMVKLQRFFGPLHKATEPMTDFRWLTPDHRVQQTKFGKTLTMTANFGTAEHQGLKGGCVRAELPGESPRELCP